MKTMREMNFSEILLSVADTLGKEFQQLHSREEYEVLRGRLNERVARLAQNKRLKEAEICADPVVAQILSRMQNLLNAAAGEEAVKLPAILEDRKSLNAALRQLDAAASGLQTQQQIDRAVMDLLAKNFSKYKSAENYIRRLVLNRLTEISPEFIYEKETDAQGNFRKDSDNRYVLASDENGSRVPCPDPGSTRLLILKQFIKVFGWCEGVKHDKDSHGEGYRCLKLKKKMEFLKYDRHEMAVRLDESIFDEFAFSSRGHAEDHNFRMIKVADSLADGFFGSKNPTREDLYVFSIAFGMTFSPTVPDKETDREAYDRDIRKNLFFDYYTDNLVNDAAALLSGEAEDSRGKKEKFVLGYGVNYKNFLEVIYLYYIAQKDLTPLEKFVRAREMINECSSSRAAMSKEDLETKGGSEAATPGTQQYKSLYSKYVAKPESEFKKMVLQKYACRNDIRVTVDLSVLTNGTERQKETFEKKVRLAAEQIAEKSGADPKKQFVKMMAFFRKKDALWNGMRRLEKKKNRNKEEEAELNRLKKKIEEQAYDFDEFETDVIEYICEDNTCEFVIPSRQMNSSIFCENNTARYVCQALLEPHYIRNDEDDSKTAKEKATEKKEEKTVIVNYENTLDGFDFLTEYGKQIPFKEFLRRCGASDRVQIKTTKKNDLSENDLSEKDLLEKALMERLDIADKRGLMLTKEEFDRRYDKLTAGKATYFDEDGTPLPPKELNRRIKAQGLPEIGTKEYGKIYVFDRNRKPAAYGELSRKKAVFDREFTIVENGVRTECGIDEAAAQFVYDKNGRPLIGYDGAFLLACRQFDESLKAEKAFRNYLMQKNRGLEFGITPDFALLIPRSYVMIEACNHLINDNTYKRRLPENMLLTFKSFYEAIQGFAVFNFNGHHRNYCGLNEMLSDCGFMEINRKNLFDIMLLYFTYRKMWSLFYVKNNH